MCVMNQGGSGGTLPALQLPLPISLDSSDLRIPCPCLSVACERNRSLLIQGQAGLFSRDLCDEGKDSKLLVEPMSSPFPVPGWPLTQGAKRNFYLLRIPVQRAPSPPCPTPTPTPMPSPE